jgi:hypothetical protein
MNADCQPHFLNRMEAQAAQSAAQIDVLTRQSDEAPR